MFDIIAAELTRKWINCALADVEKATAMQSDEAAREREVGSPALLVWNPASSSSTSRSHPTSRYPGWRRSPSARHCLPSPPDITSPRPPYYIPMSHLIRHNLTCFPRDVPPLRLLKCPAGEGEEDHIP